MSIPLFLRRNKTNLVALNELKRYVRPEFMVPQQLGNNTGWLAVAANASVPCVLTPDQNGPFEGMYLTADYGGGNMLVRITDPANTRDLMNRDVLAQTIFTAAPGGQNVFILPETLWLEQRHSIILNFTDISAAANSVRPVVHGRKFWLRQAREGIADKFLATRRLQRKVTTPYFFTTDQPVVLAAAAVAQRANITIGQEGHFVAYKMTCWSQFPFEFKILDGENGQSLSGSIFVSNTQGTGIAMDPYIFPEPWFIPKNRQLVLEMNNPLMPQNTVFLTISGRRVYDDEYREIV